MEIMFHLRKLKRNYDARIPCEENVYDAYETHFKIEKNDGRIF